MPNSVLKTARPATGDGVPSDAFTQARQTHPHRQFLGNRDGVPSDAFTQAGRSGKSFARRQPSWWQALAQRLKTQRLKRGVILLKHSRLGQTTAEYALVLLGAATVAMLLTAWAGQTNRIGSLFDAVLRSVTNLIS